MTDDRLPLSGLKVLDFGHTVMGPTAGLVLADLGAEVTRIEPPGGDPTRRLKGFGNGYFQFYNRNKASFAVDLKSDAGRDLVLRLLRRTDVLIENFGPGTMDRLGLGYDRIAEAAPRLVYLSLKGFLPGPYEDRPALDEVVQMMSGLAYMTGPPGQPLRAGASVVDVLGGVFGVVGVLAALRERETTGRGQLVRASLFEAAVFLMGQHLAYGAMTGAPVPPMPARVSAWGIYDRFDTADGQQVFLGLTSDAQWQRFCPAFDCGDLLADETLGTNNGRVAGRERLLPRVAARLAALTADEIEARAMAERLPFARISRPEDLWADPHLAAGGRLLQTPMPGGVMAGLPVTPVEIGGRAPVLRREPPGIGADNPGLIGALGLTRREIAALEAEGVLYTQPEGQADE